MWSGSAPNSASNSPRRPAYWTGSPTRPCQESPKASEKPNSTHATPTTPIVTIDIIIMLRTPLARTMPP